MKIDLFLSVKITRNTHRTDPLSGKEPEPWCGADRAVVNLAWHDIQLVELVPAFCSSFGASHFPICISGPEPDENCTERTASPGSYTVTGHSRFTQSCSSPPAHLLQLSLQLCTAPTVLSSDMTSEYMWTLSKKPPAGRAGTFECRGQYVSSSMGFVPAYRSRICRGTVCLHSQCDPMCYNVRHPSHRPAESTCLPERQKTC